MTLRTNPTARIAFLLIALTSAGLFSAKLALSQVSGGAIGGALTDATGAAIAGGRVEVTNLATNDKVASISNEIGIYLVEHLRIGDYNVVVQHPGFKELVVKNVSVVTASTTTLDIQLQVGDGTQRVTVIGESSPLVHTSDAEISSVLERKVILDLPLSLGGANQVGASGRRQIEDFAFLTPGASGNQYYKNFNGSPNLSQEVIVDGVPHARAGAPGIQGRGTPPYEAVQEFNVVTAIYPPEYRGFGVMNFTMKSGTNNFHGNAFYFIRNDKLEARGFFGSSKPTVRQNNFGVTAGGPIIKNKTFFFASFEDFILRGGATVRGLVTVPTASFKQGDFSQLINSGTGQQIPIFDPATTRSDGAGSFVRDPFPGNVIPAGRISPIAARLVGLLPPPDFPGRIQNNWVDRSSQPNDDRVWSVKIDHSFSDKHKLSGTYWWINNPARLYMGLGQGQTLDTNLTSPGYDGGIRVNDDYFITPRLLQHFGFGYSQFDHLRLTDPRHGNETLKIPGLDPNIPGYPLFLLPGYPVMGNSNQQPADPSHVPSYIWNDSLSWYHGRHQVQFGGEVWYQSSASFTGTTSGGLGGTFNIGNLETSQPNSPNFGAWGYPLASLLLGQVDSASRLVGAAKRTVGAPYLALFVADKFQVTPRLTLTFGLRYELAWPWTDVNNQMSGLDLTLPNPGAGNRPGAYVFGSNKLAPSLDKKELGPRAGLAYRLNDKTVLRTGYSLMYAQTNATTFLLFSSSQNSFDAGYTAAQSYASSNSGISPGLVLDQGFPAFTGTLPNTNPALLNGQIADYLSPDGAKQANMQNWQVGAQREIKGNIVLDVAYVGTKGTHLPVNLENLNQVPARFLSLGSLLNSSISSPAAQQQGFSAPYPGFTGTVAQSLRPYPQYLSISDAAQPLGNSTYQSLQVKIQKRFSHNLSFLTSYTLSKSLTDTSVAGQANSNSAGLDNANRQLEKSLSPIDSTHNFVTDWVYELPIGRAMKGLPGKVLRGWQLNGVVRYSRGTPLAIVGGPPLPLFGASNRPNRVLGAPERTTVSGQFDPGKDLYLNINAFSQPLPFTFGNVSRTEPTVRTPPLLNEDLSAMKRTYIRQISEVFNVEFRAEFFNAFNRTVFGAPATNLNSTTTFGVVSTQANTPRIVQFGMKINF